MKHYNTPITLELLKKHNRIFFSKENVKFHEDHGYEIIERDGKPVLCVFNDLTGKAYYVINPETYELTYTR